MCCPVWTRLIKCSISSDKEPLWITIVYTTEAKYKTLHLVAFTPDVFRLWNTTLRRLFAFRQGLLSGLGSMERKDDVWERQYWKDTDTSGDHRADFDEIERMCRRLNISSSRADLLNVFMVRWKHYFCYWDIIGSLTVLILCFWCVGSRFVGSWILGIRGFQAFRRPP